MVIGGEKVSAKRFLIVLQAYKKAHSFSVIGDKPLLNSYDEDTEDVLKSTCIIGSDTRAVEQCLRFAIPGSHTTLLAEAPLLEEYDMTVQDVIERHIKKQGVDIVTNTAILSIEPSGNYVHTTLAEDGKPRRISSDRIVIVPERFYSYDLGLGNLSDDDIEETTHDAVSKVAKNTLLIKNTPALELSVVYKAVDFLNGRSDVDFSTTKRRIYSTDKLTFFSLGIVEQDYFSTHVSYIKSICKVA